MSDTKQESLKGKIRKDWAENTEPPKDISIIHEWKEAHLVAAMRQGGDLALAALEEFELRFNEKIDRLVNERVQQLRGSERRHERYQAAWDKKSAFGHLAKKLERVEFDATRVGTGELVLENKGEPVAYIGLSKHLTMVVTRSCPVCNRAMRFRQDEPKSSCSSECAAKRREQQRREPHRKKLSATCPHCGDEMGVNFAGGRFVFADHQRELRRCPGSRQEAPFDIVPRQNGKAAKRSKKA